MISPTILKLGVSTAVGAIIRVQAQRSKDLHEERLAALNALKVTEASRNNALARGGKFVRRFITIACFSYAFIWPALVAVYTDVPFVIIQEQQVLRLWGLLGSYTKLIPIEITGYVFLKVLIEDILPCIMGFYFGSDAAKR